MEENFCADCGVYNPQCGLILKRSLVFICRNCEEIYEDMLTS